MDPGFVVDDKILNTDVNSPQEQRKKKTVDVIVINSHIFVNKIFLFQTDGENKVAGVAVQHNKSRKKRTKQGVDCCIAHFQSALLIRMNDLVRS